MIHFIQVEGFDECLFFLQVTFTIFPKERFGFFQFQLEKLFSFSVSRRSAPITVELLLFDVDLSYAYKWKF
jgi:hypothetical protein